MRRLAGWTILAAVAGAASAALAIVWFLAERGIPPRMLAPYVAKRSSGHNPVITGSGQWIKATLLSLDRQAPYTGDPALLDLRPGGAGRGTAPAPMRIVSVHDGESLRRAMDDAEPGDAITLRPGTYQFARGTLRAKRPGRADAPIVVRAEQPGSATLELRMSEGFLVTAPYWTFENLSIRGVCSRHEFCEHAFHVVGEGHHFTAINNRIVDFNSHFKINKLRGMLPDHGSIIGNTITNTSPRKTASAVTLVDLVAASHWTIRGNVITDFVKAGGDRISYGGFAKGAGAHNVFEQNIVICEHLLRAPGQRVGLSLGGGGSGKPYCRDGKCITEQDHGVIRANLIASCSDEGIYLNSAAASVVAHNTVLDTSGIVVRYPTSSADLAGNLVDGAIRVRDGGVMRLDDNVMTSIVSLYAGRHPVRALFAGASVSQLSWQQPPPRRDGASATPDLCGAVRPARPAYGAFEDLRACRP